MNLIPTIRSARPDDMHAVKLLLQSSNLPDAGIEDQFVDAFVVAEHGGEIIGVAGAEKYGDCGLLRSVAVSESFRGQSVGRMLVNECLTRASQRGTTEFYLLTLDAQRYFEGLGFIAVDRDEVPPAIGKSQEFASLCPKTATVMVLSSSRFQPVPREKP